MVGECGTHEEHKCIRPCLGGGDNTAENALEI